MTVVLSGDPVMESTNHKSQLADPVCNLREYLAPPDKTEIPTKQPVFPHAEGIGHPV